MGERNLGKKLCKKKKDGIEKKMDEPRQQRLGKKYNMEGTNQ